MLKITVYKSNKVGEATVIKQTETEAKLAQTKGYSAGYSAGKVLCRSLYSYPVNMFMEQLFTASERQLGTFSLAAAGSHPTAAAEQCSDGSFLRAELRNMTKLPGECCDFK